jgi:hypothetical protein
MRRLALALALAGAAVTIASAAGSTTAAPEFRTLDGSGNNLAHPTWGEAGTPYARLTAPNYADGIGSMRSGPGARFVSNRVFNDTGQTLFSENAVSQVGWMWGQFVDHTLDLQDETAAEEADIPFNASDPLETFQNDTGAIQFARTPAAPGTGTSTSNPRQQINTVNSFIDGWNIYGGTLDREEWLRDGPYDGDLSNNDAQMVLINGYLPTEAARGSDPLTAPPMDLMGPLVGNPQNAIVAGDVRANENLALTALTTLFVREHNRIASMVPQTLPEQTRFDIARRVVGAEEQYITYNEFLPAMGVNLPPYQGYDPNVNPSITNEFATVGFRGHSGVNGELQAIAPNGHWSATRLQQFADQGIEIDSLPDGTDTQLTIPMTDAFGNPGLLPKVGLGPLFRGVAANPGYKNDEQIDNEFRSILFQVPGPGTDPGQCAGQLPPPAGCFEDVQDLGAIDIQRGRDHGMPTYNQLRVAVGLPAVTSYTQVTGESTASFPADVNQADPIDDPTILQFDQLFDITGNSIPLGSEAAGTSAVVGIRHSTLAARLKAIYGAGNAGTMDAFVGMVSEPHLPGSELGPTQTALWTEQFEALRDGDRFFYLNDPYLTTIRQQYGIDYRHTLAQLIKLDAGVTVQPDVFHVAAS